MFEWTKRADGWFIKTAQAASRLPHEAERYVAAAEMCRRQAESKSDGNQDILHELAKVAPFSIQGMDTSTDEGRSDAMDHLELYCDELHTALDASGANIGKWSGAKQLLAEAGLQI